MKLATFALAGGAPRAGEVRDDTVVAFSDGSTVVDRMASGDHTPADGESPGPVFILQGVAEPKTGKNRMHLDVHPRLDLGVPALVERLERLGGSRVGTPVTDLYDELGIWWQVMTDPEGNEFDVIADPGHPAP